MVRRENFFCVTVEIIIARKGFPQISRKMGSHRKMSAHVLHQLGGGWAGGLCDCGCRPKFDVPEIQEKTTTKNVGQNELVWGVGTLVSVVVICGSALTYAAFFLNGSDRLT